MLLICGEVANFVNEVLSSKQKPLNSLCSRLFKVKEFNNRMV